MWLEMRSAHNARKEMNVLDTHITVAIDGPSGVGKSTIARAAARRFGLIYVDTGAIYRTVGLACERAGADCSDTAAVQALLPELKIDPDSTMSSAMSGGSSSSSSSLSSLSGSGDEDTDNSFLLKDVATVEKTVSLNTINRDQQRRCVTVTAGIADGKNVTLVSDQVTKAVKAIGYVGVGTLEFLLDRDGRFWFMEMNLRLQVEHGVTEMITGVDLVRQQLRIASGLPLDLTQEDVTLTGHAIECRINAEDPTANFRPCPGKVEFLHFPGGPGVRVDSALYNGCTLSPYYDSLAAKVMVHAPTRLEAIRRMRRCLEEFTLEGFPTNAELSYELLFHPTFVRGGCTTAFLDRSLPELLEFSRRVDDHKG